MDRTPMMRKLGVIALAMIQENIRAGVSYDGTPFRYSTNPFARPVGDIPQSRLDALTSGDSPRIQLFTKKENKSLWGLVLGGYKDWRSIMGLNPDGDYLRAQGSMLRNLNIIDVNNDHVVLGFDDPEQLKKAYWLNVTGVGPSRRLWKFLGLSEKQIQRLTEEAATMLDATALEEMFTF